MKRYSVLANVVGAALLMSAAGARLRADDLPKADAIIDKFIEVTGGKAAYEKRHAEMTTGTFEMPAMGLKAKMTAWRADPNLSYTEVELPGMGKFLDGSDGKVMWSQNPMQGARIKEGVERAQAVQTGRFNSELHWKELYKSAETKGVEQVDGKDCYKIVLTPAEGPAMTQYYDKDSGLLTKIVTTTAGPMGEAQVEIVPSDYRKEGDVLMAHKMKQSAGGQEMNITIESVTTNPDIAKDRFDLPEEIRALLKK